MKYFCIFYGVALSLMGTLHAQSIHNAAISFQGYTGLINIPNAQILEEGVFVFSYNNQFDEHLRGYDTARQRVESEDYQFGIGLFPHFEMQGRLKEQPGYVRDLSANFKYQLPHFWHLSPDIALGVQDLGSAANNYENYYIVADKDWGPVRVSLGYGYSHTAAKAQRMDGLFGGIEAWVSPSFSLMGEYDGKDTHAGIRYESEKFWYNRVKFLIAAVENLSTHNSSFQYSLRLYPYVVDQKSNSVSLAHSLYYIRSGKEKKPLGTYGYQGLLQTLEGAGLLDVVISTREAGRVVIIAYENSVFRRNEIDAVSHIVKASQLLQPRPHNIILLSKKSGIVVKAWSVTFNDTHASVSQRYFVTDASLTSRGEVVAAGEKHNRWKTHIELSWLLKTMVGTEVGVFDYQLLLGATGKWNLWEGVDFTVRYDIPLSYSSEFDSSKLGVFSYLYNKGGINSTMLHCTYAFETTPLVTTMSAGLYQYEYLGVANQLTYLKPDYTVALKMGYFEHQGTYEHPDKQEDKKFALAKFTYKYEPLSTHLSFQAGRYWNQDNGFDIELRRYFGDISVSLKYLYSTQNNSYSWAESSNKYVGLYMEIPLDFRHSKTDWKELQIEGDRAWEHGLRSTVSRDDGTNTITPGSGVEPRFDIEHYRDMFNRDRVNPAYLNSYLNHF